ncbi:Na+/H+ antiporter [Mycolicibacillus koreensis]|nr:Na+/H+ antiporter [Mycolicibacillus koreensis]
MDALLLAVVGSAVLVTATARHFNLSAPLVLVGVGLVFGIIPAIPDVTMGTDLVLFVILPPLLWSAGLESSYLNMRRNARSISLLAVGLPLATTLAVGVVAYYVVPALSLPAAFTLGAIVAPPDAVSATAVGRRLGLPRRIMTLLTGESLLNDATALTAYKVALGAAIGATVTFAGGLAVFVAAAVGGVVTGLVSGSVLVWVRSKLTDPLAESAVGLVAPFVIYLVAEVLDGSGVVAVVVAALLLGQRFTRAHYATRLQDQAVWRALTLMLESFAFMLIGLQLPTVIANLHGDTFASLLGAAAAVMAAVLGMRIVWVWAFAYLPRRFSTRIREREPAPTAAQVAVLAWAGMRGVVSLAAAFGVPVLTLSGHNFPGRPQLVFLTFVVVVGTLMLHGLTLPWLIRRLGVYGDEARTDAVAAATAQDKAARAALERLDEVLASSEPSETTERAAEVLRVMNARRRNAARERLRRQDDPTDLDESVSDTFKWLRLEMLAAERATFVAERDAGHIDDQVLRALMHGLDLEEAALNL